MLTLFYFLYHHHELTNFAHYLEKHKLLHHPIIQDDPFIKTTGDPVLLDFKVTINTGVCFYTFHRKRSNFDDSDKFHFSITMNSHLLYKNDMWTERFPYAVKKRAMRESYFAVQIIRKLKQAHSDERKNLKRQQQESLAEKKQKKLNELLLATKQPINTPNANQLSQVKSRESIFSKTKKPGFEDAILELAANPFDWKLGNMFKPAPTLVYNKPNDTLFPKMNFQTGTAYRFNKFSRKSELIITSRKLNITDYKDRTITIYYDLETEQPKATIRTKEKDFGYKPDLFLLSQIMKRIHHQYDDIVKHLNSDLSVNSENIITDETAQKELYKALHGQKTNQYSLQTEKNEETIYYKLYSNRVLMYKGFYDKRTGIYSAELSKLLSKTHFFLKNELKSINETLHAKAKAELDMSEKSPDLFQPVYQALENLKNVPKDDLTMEEHHLVFTTIPNDISELEQLYNSLTNQSTVEHVIIGSVEAMRRKIEDILSSIEEKKLQRIKVKTSVIDLRTKPSNTPLLENNERSYH